MNEQRLKNAAEAWFPATPSIAPAVRLRLRGTPPAPRRRSRRVLVVALAALVLTGGAVAAAALLDVIPGVRIDRVEQLPEATFTAPPSYGRETTLEVARRTAPFPVRLPERLGPPTHVFVDRDAGGAAVVSTVYGGRERAGAVLTQWAARSILFHKLLEYDARVAYVNIGAARGVWVEGRDHAVFYLGRAGREERVDGYLAGNVLVWQHGGVSYRLETAASRGRALEVARSLRP